MGPLRSFCLPRPRSGAQSLKKRPLKLQELKEASFVAKKKKGNRYGWRRGAVRTRRAVGRTEAGLRRT
ncbi:hypothetical protein V6Z11_A06G056900 [Gossypium hirsutum]